MPLFEHEVDFDTMRRLARECVCLECGCLVQVAWGGFIDYDGYILRCGNDVDHRGVKRLHSPGPYDIPGFNLFNLTKGRKKMVSERFGEEASTKLAKYHGVTSLTKPQVTEILKTIWKDAPETEMQRAVILCVNYGLNPLMNHVFLIPFKGKDGTTWATIMGIKAKRLLASRKKPFSYIDDTPRVMTEKEQTKIFGAPEPTKLWVITKLCDGVGNEVVGYGFCPKDTQPYGTDKGNTQFNMAAIRSESQALDRLAPGEMPVGVEAMPEEVAAAMSGGEDKLTEAVSKEKIKTGDAGTVEGKFREVTEPPAPAPDPPAPAASNTLEDLKETMQLCNWSAEDLGKFANEEKGWRIKEYKDLKPEQVAESIAHIQKNPK